jgi:UDP:flavonoid glycosyltransferase YjiC (YdhE family)
VRVLVSCSIGGAGHLNPLRPLIEALRARGDEVLVVVPPALEARVAECGYLFRVGAEPEADTLAEIRVGIATASRADAAVLSERELFGRLCTAAMLPAMEAAFAEWRPGLVLRETCEYSAAIVARRRGVPQAQVAISQGEIEASALGVAAPVLEAYEEGVVGKIRASPYMTRFPSSLDPPSYPDTRRYREAPVAGRVPLPDWWGDDASPLAYLTFGSVTGSMPIAADVYRIALDAMSGLPVRVLLTVGKRTDIAGLGPIAADVHVEPWVAQDDVFAEAALVVCHGGSGTTFGALAAGLPLVVVPLFADQFSNGRSVAAAGAGLLVEPATSEGGRRPTVRPEDAARIASAVMAVLDDPTYSRAAAAIAQEMDCLPSVEEVLAALMQ